MIKLKNPKDLILVDAIRIRWIVVICNLFWFVAKVQSRKKGIIVIGYN